MHHQLKYHILPGYLFKSRGRPIGQSQRIRRVRSNRLAGAHPILEFHQLRAHRAIIISQPIAERRHVKKRRPMVTLQRPVKG